MAGSTTNNYDDYDGFDEDAGMYHPGIKLVPHVPIECRDGFSKCVGFLPVAVNPKMLYNTIQDAKTATIANPDAYGFTSIKFEDGFVCWQLRGQPHVQHHEDESGLCEISYVYNKRQPQTIHTSRKKGSKRTRPRLTHPKKRAITFPPQLPSACRVCCDGRYSVEELADLDLAVKDLM